MSIRERLLGTRAGAAIIIVLVIAASLTGVLVAGQLIISPSMHIAPSVALAGNPVTVEIIPPGPVVKGSFFNLLSLSYHSDSKPSDVHQLQNTSGLSVQHVFNEPGNYTIIASYTNGGHHGNVAGALTVLPSTFTTGPLRYGSSASYHGSNGTLSLSNPFGIYNVPVVSLGSKTNLSIINVGMALTTTLNVSVSDRNMVVRDGLSLDRPVYAINSTALVTGQGYVSALIGGVGLNLSAELSLKATSTTLNSIADNSTVAQKSNLTAELSVGYLDGTIQVLPASSTTIDSFTQAYSINRLLFSSIGNNGTFSMPQYQMNLYRNSLPEEMLMNLGGTANGYSWKTGVFEPSLNQSSLAVEFGPMSYNATYSVALDSLSALPASYSVSQTADINGTSTHLTVLLSRNTLLLGGKAVNATGGQNVPTERGNYMTWQNGPLPLLNNSALLPFSLTDAYGYSVNETNISSFLSENPGAFLSYASYNFSQEEWIMTFASGSGSAYSVTVTLTGTAVNCTSYFTASAPILRSPFGSAILTVGSAADIAAASQYSNYFLNKSGNLSLTTLTFQLQLLYQPVISPFLPPPVQHAAFAFVLSSAGGALLAIDATNGQLLYFVTGFDPVVLP